jgi:radical SAM superfamily enzyme YgiQ (UPF0313 family)
MKIKYLLPLLFSLLAFPFILIALKPTNDLMLSGCIILALGFILTYFSGVHETLKNIETVIKIGIKTPFLIPIAFFVIPNLILLSLNISKLSVFKPVVLCLTVHVAAYFAGIILLIKHQKLRIRSIDSISVSNYLPKKRLLLINPVNSGQSGLTVNRSSVFPPLGLGIIAALTPDDFEIQLIDENIEPFRFITADLVGITAFTASVNRAYQIADVYREQKIPVIMGGIHASMLPEEALNHVDSVVIGEAETIWEQVINDFRKAELKRTYQGRLSELVNMVIPRRDLFSEKYLFATIQTSRGCPMDCYFCSVTPFNGEKYRQRPYEEVLDELEQIPQKMIFFLDDNILGYGKEAEERAIRLFKRMVNRGLNKSWFCQASLNFGNNEEVLKWAAKSGCKMVFIGLESADPEELQEMHKSLNLRLEYDRAFQKIHKYGIVILGAFIFGSDAETKEGIVRKTKYILKSPIDVVQTTTLTPLPGTRLFKQYQDQKRLVLNDFPADWRHYNMTELTYTIKHITKAEFEREMAWCIKKIYSKPAIIKRFLRTIRLTRKLETGFWAYQSNLNYRNVGSTSGRTENKPLEVKHEN